MTRRELERLVQGMADGVLSGEEFSALQGELRASGESRAFFRESMEVEQLLDDVIRVRVPGSGSERRMEGLLRQRQRRNLSWALLAAAAVLAISALVLHRYFLAPPDRSVRVSFTSGTAWNGEVGEGGLLKPGDLLRVEYGVVAMRLPSGVRGVIEGPAEMVVVNPSVLELRQGRGWFRVEEAGRGFLVRTPQIEVRDLGTEFGVVSRPNEFDEVHVFEGRVEVRALFALKEGQPLEEGGALRVSPVGRWVDEQPDEDAFLKALPRGLPGIRFTFDGAEPLRPEGEHPAVAGMEVHTGGGEGPTLVEGIRGAALQVSGPSDMVVTDWPGIAGAERRTIACWVRCDEKIGGFVGLVSWGDGSRDYPGRCNLVAARSPRHGEPVLRFSMGHDVNFTGATPLRRGEWHHVAVVFRGLQSEYGDMVELYVDGEREVIDPEFTRPPREDQQIRTVIDGPNSMPLRIGMGPYPTRTATFLGDIDEVVILPRAVSPLEVRGLMDR